MADLDSTELHIRDTPQYFFDTGLIEEIQNITRTVHSPVMFEGNPILTRKTGPGSITSTCTPTTTRSGVTTMASFTSCTPTLTSTTRRRAAPAAP